ncbi:hypothetical protein K8354_13115 [Polaribacter litorisediminis]|uniref:CRISPR-associated primase-polymerase type B n=1 Tax=Polaribacter litorisediminis TaxID=1908341 RepID=UPI001CBE9835|nr:CRISPR-associated primase-polymerase type B [Polaribacter litorisediminis]UAM97253.1 hypothetical protein K8354_13115 [Polaribacter litorisediminis]
MVYYSTDISKSNTVPLSAISMSNLIQKFSDKSLKYTVDKLRKVRGIDKASFGFLKRKLPYFIGAEFKDNFRCSENFCKVDFLIIDIDAYGDEEKITTLKETICKDARVKLAFISPSGTGLKVVFKLSNPIASLKEYSNFYQIFSRSFAKQYVLENYVDFSTSDATRICFLSYDENVYYNNNATNLEVDFYSDTMFPFIDEIEDVLNKDNSAAIKPGKPAISNQTYAEILKTLKPKTLKKQKQYTVPAPLKELKELLPTNFSKHHVNVISIDEINYGLKLKIGDTSLNTIINIYYGKKGFTVVKNLAQKPAAQLAEASVLIIENLIYNTNSDNYEEEEERSAFEFDSINTKEADGGVD